MGQGRFLNQKLGKRNSRRLEQMRWHLAPQNASRQSPPKGAGRRGRARRRRRSK